MTAIIVFILRLLFILLAYLFLGWMGYTIFSDLRYTHKSARNEQPCPITLLSQSGNQSQEKKLIRPEIIIGRDPACDFILNEETISLRHCKLHFHHKHWWVEDLGSTNGTKLLNQPITTPTIITHNDELQLGQVTLSIKIE